MFFPLSSMNKPSAHSGQGNPILTPPGGPHYREDLACYERGGPTPWIEWLAVTRPVGDLRHPSTGRLLQGTGAGHPPAQFDLDG